MSITSAGKGHWVNTRVRQALAAGSNLELLKALVEVFPGSWFFTRLDGSFAFVNQQACDTLGYTRDELMALTLYDVNPTLTPAIWKELLAVGNFNPASVRTVHKRKDGSVFPVEAFGSRIIVGDENVSLSYVVDLSEEAQARQALAEKQYLLQSLLDNAPVILWSVDSEARVQLCEGSALPFFGLAAGQILGKQMAERLPTLGEMVTATERALQGQPTEGVVSLDTHDFEFRYLPQRNGEGQVIGATGVAIDVTARRRAEHSHRRLLAAIEQTDVSILLLDPNGSIEYANSAFEALASTPKLEATGRRWLDLLPDGSAQESARSGLARAIAGGTVWRGTLRSQRPDGSDCIQQATLSPLRDAQEQVTGFVAVCRDVTSQTQAEEHLRQIEKMEAVGQLAAGVAHDFNNLLQVIVGNVELSLMAPSLEQGRTRMSEIREAGKRAAGLVRQLLTFSQNVDTPQSIDLAELIMRLMPILRRLLGEHIAIQLRKGEDRFEVWGDGNQIEQIIVNLCVNARDAMPGGGRLDFRLSARHYQATEAVQLGLSGAGRYVILEVKDTGCGMTEDVQRRACEPFFTTKAPGVGTGLGLATVYGVAKRHGGNIEIQSQPGLGSCFRVFLRASEHPQKVDRQPTQRTVAPTRSLRILLAEDNPSVREIIRDYLIQAGHEVTSAGSGIEAIGLIERGGSSFDLLVLDAIMPGANGPEVFRRFRALSPAPVLFTTGHDFDVLVSILPDGSWATLRKPFSADDLTAAIARLMGTPPSGAGRDHSVG